MAMEHEDKSRSREQSPGTSQGEPQDPGGAYESASEGTGERLRPGQLAREAKRFVQERAAPGAMEAVRGARDMVRENPIPAAALLVGGAAALLAVRQRANGGDAHLGAIARHFARNGHARKAARRGEGWLHSGRSDLFGGEPSSLLGFLKGGAERASSTGTQATERALELASRLRHSGAAATAQHQMERARGELEHFAREQPQVFGIASFVLGFVLGGALRARRSNGGASRGAEVW